VDENSNAASLFYVSCVMKFLIGLLFSLVVIPFTFAQVMPEENELIARLNPRSDLPKDLLAGRSVVFIQPTFTSKELETVQMYFQQTGIDAVAYIDIQRVLSGIDVQRAFANYFNVRKILFLIILRKTEKEYECTITELTGNLYFTDKSKVSWRQSNASLAELLQILYRFSISSLKRMNFLINDLPETTEVVSFASKHNERFSFEVKTFKSAIPRFSNEEDQTKLEAYLKENLPAKYDFVDPALTDAELLQKGYHMVMRFVHTRGELARQILGYDPTPPASSIATNYFSDGQLKIKTIPVKQVIYKFYFKNLEYGEIYLGSKWDADETWQDALKNHVDALRLDQKF
jgi:hypothetical protein